MVVPDYELENFVALVGMEYDLVFVVEYGFELVIPFVELVILVGELVILVEEMLPFFVVMLPL